MSTTPPEGGNTSVTLLYQKTVPATLRGRASGDDLWLTLPDMAGATGWELEDDGVCREGLCVPLPEVEVARYFIDEAGGEAWFNLAEFARLMEQPVAHDAVHNVWYFGPPAWEWRNPLPSPLAPDFTLPDLQGRLSSLSDFLGKKVLLACWASW